MYFIDPKGWGMRWRILHGFACIIAKLANFLFAFSGLLLIAAVALWLARYPLLACGQLAILAIVIYAVPVGRLATKFFKAYYGENLVMQYTGDAEEKLNHETWKSAREVSDEVFADKMKAIGCSLEYSAAIRDAIGPSEQDTDNELVILAATPYVEMSSYDKKDRLFRLTSEGPGWRKLIEAQKSEGEPGGRGMLINPRTVTA